MNYNILILFWSLECQEAFNVYDAKFDVLTCCLIRLDVFKN